MHSQPKRTLQNYHQQSSSTIHKINHVFSNHPNVAFGNLCSINKQLNSKQVCEKELNHQEKIESVKPYILHVEEQKFLKTFGKVGCLKGNFDGKLLDTCVLHHAQALNSQGKQNKSYINGTFILQNGRLYSNKESFLKNVQFDDQQWLSDQQQIEQPQTTMNFSNQQIQQDKQNYNYLEEDEQNHNQSIHQIYPSRNSKEDGAKQNKGMTSKTEVYRCSTIEEVTQPSNTISGTAMMFVFSQQSGGHIDKRQSKNILQQQTLRDCVALHTRRRQKL